jgi:cytochrome c oxidase assembly protein subunit 15
MMTSDYSPDTRAAFRRIRTLAAITLGLAFVHIVFGAIVRITGSGMGCGDHWPKCHGYWVPPMDRPDLIIEVTHRYLASVVALFTLALAIVNWRLRPIARVGGAAGPWRTSLGALVAVLVTAIVGGVTVKMGNTMVATVAHWLLAMTLLAFLVMTIVRTADRSVDARPASPKTWRSSAVAALLAALAVAMGGVTAKYPGAPVACPSFPMCGSNAAVAPAAGHIQMTHRVIAVLLVLHLVGLIIALRKRRAAESAGVLRVAQVALGLAVLQLLIAGAMIGMKLPPVLRSVHQAVGTLIWITTFGFAYMARLRSLPVITEEVFPVSRPSGQRKTIARQSLGAREQP